MFKNFFVHNPLVKFLCVGGISALFGYSVILTLFRSGLNYILAFIIGYLTGMLIGAYLNHHWTFSVKTKVSAGELVSYFLLYSGSLFLGSLLLYFLAQYLSIRPEVGNVYSMILSTACNYFGLKYFVFKMKAEPIKQTYEDR